MKADPLESRYAELQQLIVGTVVVAAVLAVSVQMLGGGWLGCTIVFVGVTTCGLLLVRRVGRHLDRLRAKSAASRQQRDGI